MSLTKETRQSKQLSLPFMSEHRHEGVESNVVSRKPEPPARSSEALLSMTEETQLMEEVVERKNLIAALKRVRSNKGAPGIDDMTVDELPEYLKEHWPAIREQLLSGKYKATPVRRVEIPKPGGGGFRKLGIPTVLDRFVQQAVLQVLQSRWDQTFSESSHGFRPGRLAHDAVSQSQQYVAEGRRYVVDMDLAPPTAGSTE